MSWTTTRSRSRRRHELTLALSLALTLDAGTAPAQPAPSDVVIGSASAGIRLFGDRPEQDLLRHPPLALVEDPAAPAMAAGLPAKIAGPFDPARFGFEFLDLFFGRIVDPDDEPSMLAPVATLRLVVRARTGDRPPRWWRLVPRDRPDVTVEAADVALRLDLLTISVPDASPDPIATAVPDQVRLATPDPALPILDVVYAARSVGANSTTDLTRHLLFDWSSAQPRVLALIDDVEYWGGGACNAFDSIYDTSAEIGCRWDPYLRDFRCAETVHRFDTQWGARRGSRFFLLDAGTRLAAPHTTTLDQLIEDAGMADWRPDDDARLAVTSVDGYGDVTMVGVAHLGKRKVALLAAPSLSKSFGVRWLAVVSDERRRQTRHEIAARTSLGSGTNDEPLPALTPDGDRPMLSSRTRYESDGLHVLEVRVREGRGRGIYLVGLELTGDRFVGDALLAATDAASYDACNTWTLPATAVSMAVTTTPGFMARLDVEPSRSLDDEDRVTPRKGDSTCPSTARVRWNAGEGFAIEWTKPACQAGAPARRAQFADEGGLREPR